MAGYNTEIDRLGVRYHVQTQDKGPRAPYIESIIFKSGRVLSSRRNSYIEHLEHPDLKSKLRELLKKQHQMILDEVSSGRFDHC